MGFFSRLFGIPETYEKRDIPILPDVEPNKPEQPTPVKERYESSVLPEGKLVDFPDEVLDTTSRDATEEEQKIIIKEILNKNSIYMIYRHKTTKLEKINIMCYNVSCMKVLRVV